MMVVMMVVVMVVMVHGGGKRGVRSKQQQSGNDGDFLHDDELYLGIYWACMAARTGSAERYNPISIDLALPFAQHPEAAAATAGVDQPLRTPQK